jgi:hypothetical protein
MLDKGFMSAHKSVDSAVPILEYNVHIALSINQSLNILYLILIVLSFILESRHDFEW